MEKNRLERKNAISVNEAIKLFFKDARMAATHNTHRIFEAWDEASGAGNFTKQRYFRDGVLHVTVSSSVIRNQLHFQKQALIEKMNAILSGDPLFIQDDPNVQYVKEILLK